MKKRIVCFGDSNTWGYDKVHDGARFPEEVRWTGRLAGMLGPDYTVIEEAQNGRTTVWDDPVGNRMAGIKYLWPCMESHSPFDLIIIMLGTNDAKGYFNVSAQTIARSAGRLVWMAMTSPFGPDKVPPQVLLVSPIRIEDHEVFRHMFGAQAARKSLEYPAAFREQAELYGCHFLDAAEYTGPGAADGLHLDPEGHALLAQAMYRKVKEILG